MAYVNAALPKLAAGASIMESEDVTASMAKLAALSEVERKFLNMACKIANSDAAAEVKLAPHQVTVYAKYIMSAPGYLDTLSEVGDDNSHMSPIQRIHRTLEMICP